MEKPSAPVENLAYMLKSTGANTAKLSLAWENYCGTVTVAVK
jgi:hypothetical protein